MSQNALLRSVKGLGIPGTARKEDKKSKLKVAACAIEDDRQGRAIPDFQIPKDHFAVRNGVRCAGAHLIVDLHGATRLDDIDHIEATLRRCVDAAKATLLHIHLHHFQPNGVSGVSSKYFFAPARKSFSFLNSHTSISLSGRSVKKSFSIRPM